MIARKLIEILEHYNEDNIVVDVHGNEIDNIAGMQDIIVLSVNKPIGYCKNCGYYVYSIDDLGALNTCPNCKRPVNGFEIHKITFKEDD
jgi:predicted Zn-ribbon and HTH transcriptional regulator